MPHYPCVAWVGGVFSVSLPTLLGTPSIYAFILLMSTNNYYNFGTISNDHSKHVTVNVPAGTNVADIVRTFMADDVEPVQEDTPQRREYCIYICREKLEEQGIYTLEEFEDMMANASKGIATDFAAFLKRYKAQGILNFMGHSKRKIFDYFRDHYPEMRAYEYPNFAAAF